VASKGAATENISSHDFSVTAFAASTSTITYPFSHYCHSQMPLLPPDAKKNEDK